jgi:prophage regulatory protein
MPPPIDGYVRRAVAVSISGVSNSTMKRWIAARRFPAPIKMSSQTPLWSVAALRQWAADPINYRAE